MTQDYGWHREQARSMWIDKFFNEHHPQHKEWTQRRSMYSHDEDIASECDEFMWALESFDQEMETLKLVFDYKHGTCLKIKWESGAWWSGDRVNFYYCVLMPMNGIAMFEPATLARMKPKQRKLMWWN
jgi:hypothetical protein